MKVDRIAEGLWRWTAPHPEWSEEKGGAGGWEADVASVYYEGEGAVVLIDPIVPASGADRESFWRALDRDLDRLADRPLVVLVSCPWHRRNAGEVAERYRERAGTKVMAHEDAAAFLAEIGPTPFREGDALPGRVHPFRIEGIEPAETAFWIPAHAALVFADAVIGGGAGTLRLCPPSWLAEGAEGRERHASQVRPSVRRLCDLPAERILPSHGEAVLRGGAVVLAEAVELPPWGE